jgi:excisionase family DNA binding protein
MSGLLTCADAAKVVSGIGRSITPNGIRMASERGRLRVSQRTASGIRLFLFEDVIAFARSRTGRKALRCLMKKKPAPAAVAPSPWLTITEAARYMRIGRKTIYGAVRGGRLRAAVVDGRRALRFRATWCDEFLEATSTPRMIEVSRRGVA